ncbi:ABC transporter permease [Paenibacillus xylaniclasticus]|uniref:ABC transporter permease n=1 Tax=Paenibacillus xylaniclasticus TaxID=588083 RepID=UPI000FDC1C28|nr:MULTISPECIES: ABC transporter permease [Paenibacillus]GFN30075.1 ABC transporter permease [Paenibacillus curdlanolyticus]
MQEVMDDRVVIREEVRPRLKHWLIRFAMQDKSTLFSLIVCCLIVVLTLIAPWIAPFDPEKSVADSLIAPNAVHWFGTDNTGMDVLSRMLYAPRIIILISLGSLAVAILFGVPLGLIAGYYSGARGLLGKLSEGLMRFFDVLQAFPIFVLAMILMSVAEPSPISLIAVISVVNIPIYVRLMRSEVLQLRKKLYVDAARVIGNKEINVIIKHVLPNAMEPILAQASVTIGMSALLISGLSFVGAGISPPTPEWGSMIAIGASDVIYGYWWPAVFPGLGLGLTVYCFALLGEGVRKFAKPTANVDSGK